MPYKVIYISIIYIYMPCPYTKKIYINCRSYIYIYIFKHIYIYKYMHII